LDFARWTSGSLSICLLATATPCEITHHDILKLLFIDAQKTSKAEPAFP
jgi:hypothetical protein